MSDWDRWVRLWCDLGGTADRAVFEQLLARYAEPHRAYHTIEHVRHCLDQLDAALRLSQRPAELEVAIWFHDAVYDTHRSDNEELSAQWAHQHMLEQGLSDEAAARVRSLILATKHDALSADPETALLMDIDLASLGRSAAEFERQGLRVRHEYDWVPERDFCVGRARVLDKFLERDWIYQTEFFRERYERQARINLERAVVEMKARSGDGP
jgi:predicted metal-dependent HD superfamily phosphohydrolase